MHILPILFALFASIIAALPASDSPTAMAASFNHSTECLSPPPESCSGVAQKDVIVWFHENSTQETRDLSMKVTKESGGKMYEEVKGVGYVRFQS